MRRLSAILLLSVMVLSVSCTGRRYYQVTGYAQGGTYSIKYRGASVGTETVRQMADSLLREVDFTLSGYNKGSLLSRLNGGDTVVLTSMFAEIYRLSYEMWELSGGAFDVACGPLFDLWGFGFREGAMPDDGQVRAALAACGTARLVGPDAVDSLARAGASVTGRALLKSNQAVLPVLNFNAIAQGYSCDLVCDMLRGLGVTDMLVDIGEIRCCGLNPSGKGWSIGIDNPVDGNNTPGKDIREVWTSDGGDHGVVTSGNYRKFYIRDGRKYSHTIDPRTGRPVEHDLLSATVIAPTAAEADALATFFMVVGADSARAYLAKRPDLDAYLITSDSLWHAR
ncbi:MAG: FAD:protein FMN transferase [Bacteroidales bacterium]|nr:FAD:protein FMN transferase [Bacteroidales bacterium]